jgi:hypothetical protein
MSPKEITVVLRGVMRGSCLHALNDENKIKIVGLSKETLRNFENTHVRAKGNIYFIGKSNNPRLKLETFNAL